MPEFMAQTYHGTLYAQPTVLETRNTKGCHQNPLGSQASYLIILQYRGRELILEVLRPLRGQ